MSWYWYVLAGVGLVVSVALSRRGDVRDRILRRGLL